MTLREQPGVPQQFPQGPRSLRLGSSVQTRDRREPRPQATMQRQTRTPRPDEQEQDDDRIYETRLPSSTRRYQQPVAAPAARKAVYVHVGERPPGVPARRTRTQDYAPVQVPEPEPARRRLRLHPLVWFGLGLLAMLILFISLSALLTWWSGVQDDWHYGRPRTYQTDQVVGHNDAPDHPSHFLALNLRGQVEVIEIPGGDASHERVFIGPTLAPEQSLTPVTLQFRDVNGDGKPDMLICYGDNRAVFLNDAGSFRPPKAGETITL